MGKKTWKKNVAAFAAEHGIPYVATCSPGYPMDLLNKAKKAAMTPGPAYLHIYSPCPTGWRSPGEKSMELARLAVEANVFPLYEVIDGQYILSKKISKPKTVAEYFKMQRRFRHLTESDVQYIQGRVDEEYAALEARCVVPGGKEKEE
jgi:pyruvate ferredoxin oxidoreductase beta subunit